MRARIGEWEFDHSKYDPEADVLYLTIGAPQEGYGEETPEGHFLRFNDDGEFFGVTILDAKRIWEEQGRLCITMAIPKRIELAEDQFQLA